MTTKRWGHLDMVKKDRQILRELAMQVAEIAALPIQKERKAMWQRLNRLQPVKPLIDISQVPWHEMDVDGELALQTEDEFCRRLEWQLRQALYEWRHMPGDMFVFSHKPNPAILAAESWDPEAARQDLTETLTKTQARGCVVEIMMKDISTVRYQPQRLWEWARIATEVTSDFA